MKKKVAMLLALFGKSVAKAEINVNSPWIHFQPGEPEAVTRMRSFNEMKSASKKTR